MVSSVKKQQDKLDSNPLPKGVLTYPSDLQNNGTGHYMMFNIFVVDGSKFSGGGGASVENPKISDSSSGSFMRSRVKTSRNTKRIDTAITLYMPDVVSNGLSTQWDTSELGTISRMLDFGNTITDDIEGNFSQVAKALGYNMANSAIQMLTPLQTKDIREFSTGTVTNPYIEMLFRMVDHRQFQFEFKFTPKNEKETQTVKDIIKTFRLHSLPEFKIQGAKTHFLYPSEFDISFFSNGAENEWIEKISTCALTNIEVNRSGGGAYSVLENDSQTEIHLVLSFTELELMTKERIEEGF